MRRIQYARPPDPAAADVAISPDGRLGLTGLWTGEISLWDYASGQEIRRLRGHTEMAFGGGTSCPTAAGLYQVRAIFSPPPKTIPCACGMWQPGKSYAAWRGIPTRCGIRT